MSAASDVGVKSAGAEALGQSPVLPKALGFAGLALAQILIVMVPEFFGTAVKAGSLHAVLWLLAILLFFIPQAMVVSHLNRLMPLEGGLYEWAVALVASTAVLIGAGSQEAFLLLQIWSWTFYGLRFRYLRGRKKRLGQECGYA